MAQTVQEMAKVNPYLVKIPIGNGTTMQRIDADLLEHRDGDLHFTTWNKELGEREVVGIFVAGAWVTVVKVVERSSQITVGFGAGGGGCGGGGHTFTVREW